MAQPGGGLGHSRKALAGHPLWAGVCPQSQTMLFKMTQRGSKTLWPVWRTFSTFSNYLLTQEGPPAFPTLTSRCKREEPPFQNHPFQARQQKRWWENITTSVHLNLQQNFSHQVLEAMKTVDTLLISYGHPGLPWTSYNLAFWATT